MVSGATFAYFRSIKIAKISPEIEVKSAVTELISFNIGSEISILATKDNLAKDLGNLTSDTYATASLRVADGNHTLSYRYNLILEIEKNDFIYSTQSMTPEILLTVTDPNDQIITELGDLEFVTVNGVSGFDITTAVGKYFIADNYLIETNTEKMDLWKAKVTFLNLDESQNMNYNRELKGFIKLEKTEA